MVLSSRSAIGAVTLQKRGVGSTNCLFGLACFAYEDLSFRAERGCSVVDDSDEAEAPKAALRELVAILARASAKASFRIGVDFDVDDPRVARWLILATFEGICMPSARSAPDELLK